MSKAGRAVDSTVLMQLGWVAMVVALPGCIGRTEIVESGHQLQGVIYYEGLPLASGTVRLASFEHPRADEEELPISEGFFRGRVSAGKKLVRVTALRPIPNQVGPSGEPVLEQYIPPCVPLGPMVFDVNPNDENYLEIDLLARPLPEADLFEDPDAYEKLVRKNREHRQLRAAAKSSGKIQ